MEIKIEIQEADLKPIIAGINVPKKFQDLAEIDQIKEWFKDSIRAAYKIGVSKISDITVEVK